MANSVESPPVRQRRGREVRIDDRGCVGHRARSSDRVGRRACRCVRSDLAEVGADDVADEVRALGRTALPIGADLSTHEAVRELVRTVLDQFGRIDILV